MEWIDYCTRSTFNLKINYISMKIQQNILSHKEGENCFFLVAG